MPTKPSRGNSNEALARGFAGQGGWQTFWQGELKFINEYRHGQKPYRVDKIYKDGSKQSQDFTNDPRDDLQENRGRRRMLMAAVDTKNMEKWGGNEFNHYVAIDGFDGYTGDTPSLSYIDTAWYEGRTQVFGEYRDTASDFLSKDILNPDVSYYSSKGDVPDSDKVVLH